MGLDAKQFKNNCKYFNYYQKRKKDLETKIELYNTKCSEDDSIYGYIYEQQWLSELIKSTEDCFDLIQKRCGGRILKLIKAKYVDGLSDEELVALANCSYSTVKNELKKALEKALG